MKGEMFRLGQREVVAGLASWDPHLAAGIGKEPAAPRRARCCFIYLRTQVTFGEERHTETCLWGLPASTLISSVTRFPQKGQDQELSGGRFSISFNWSVNIHPLDSTVWLQRAAWVVVIYLFIPSAARFRHLNAKSVSAFEMRRCWWITQNAICIHLCASLFTLLGEMRLCQYGVGAFFSWATINRI